MNLLDKIEFFLIVEANKASQCVWCGGQGYFDDLTTIEEAYYACSCVGNYSYKDVAQLA